MFRKRVLSPSRRWPVATEPIAVSPEEVRSRSPCGQCTRILPPDVAHVSDGLFPSSKKKGIYEWDGNKEMQVAEGSDQSWREGIDFVWYTYIKMVHRNHILNV